MPPWQDALARYLTSRLQSRIDSTRSTVNRTSLRESPTARSHDDRAQARRSPGTRSAPANRCRPPAPPRGFSRSRRIRKSANDSVGGCSLARMPLPDSRRSSMVTPSQQPPRRLGERLERQAVALVVVLPLLIPDRRPEPDLSARRPDRWTPRPWPERVRQRVDEALTSERFAGVNSAYSPRTRIDREGLAAEHARHLVGVQPGGVDDDARRGSPRARCGAPCRRRGGRRRRSCVPGRNITPASVAGAQERLDVALRRSRCRCRATRARNGVLTAGSRADDEGAVDDLETRRRRSPCRAAAALRARGPRARRARRSACRTARAARVRRAELVHQLAAFDAQPRLQRAGRIVDAGVDHAAVVRAGVHARARMPLEHADRSAASPRCARADARPVTPAADDGDVDAVPTVSSGSRWRRSRDA